MYTGPRVRTNPCYYWQAVHATPMTFPKRWKKEFEYAQNWRSRNKMIETKGKTKKKSQTPFKLSLTFCDYVIVLITLIIQTFHLLPLTNQTVVLLIVGTGLSAFSIVWVHHSKCCSLYSHFKNISTPVDFLSKSQMWVYGPRNFHNYISMDSQKLNMKNLLNPITDPLYGH